jgi:hypothetical protein
MVNWSLAQQPNAFERERQSAFQQAEYQRQRGEQTAQRNALAGYATNPNDQTFNALAQAAPEYAIQVRGQRDQQAQEQQVQQLHLIVSPVHLFRLRFYSFALNTNAKSFICFTIDTSPLERVGERCSFRPIASIKKRSSFRISSGVCPDSTLTNSETIPFTITASLSAV